MYIFIYIYTFIDKLISISYRKKSPSSIAISPGQVAKDWTTPLILLSCAAWAGARGQSGQSGAWLVLGCFGQSKTIETIGKPWETIENHGKTIENHGKTIEKP